MVSLFSSPKDRATWDPFQMTFHSMAEINGGPDPNYLQVLGSPLFISHLGHLEGEQPYLGDLLTIVANYLLSGMTLQVETIPK